MKLAIKTTKLDDDTYLAQVDWEKHDAGQVGTPGAVCYGDCGGDAYESLKRRLEEKGHTIIEENK